MAAQSRICVVVLAAVIMVAGCTDSAELPSPRQATSTSALPVPSDPAEIQKGGTYRTRAGMHCGLEFLAFADREWRVLDPPKRLRLLMGPVPVEITYVDRDTLRLTVNDDAAEAAGVSVVLRPTNEHPPQRD